MRRSTTYGKKGGQGPTRGKTATVFIGKTPDGIVWRKKVFKQYEGDTLIATGFMHDGIISITVWPGEPVWEGDFGRMTARRLTP